MAPGARRRRWCWSISPPTSPRPAAAHTAERIGRQPDVFASVDEALAYHGHENVPAQSPLRARYEAFLKPVAGGYQLRRDLSFRDNFKKALDTGQSAPVPAFLWPMLSELKIPALVIRGTQSDMLDAPTLEKARQANPRVTGVELAGSHDLAGDNPDGLAKAIRALPRHVGRLTSPQNENGGAGAPPFAVRSM